MFSKTLRYFCYSPSSTQIPILIFGHLLTLYLASNSAADRHYLQFEPHKNIHGVQMCALNDPSYVTNDTTHLLQCSLLCMSKDYCQSFNYKTGGNIQLCELFGFIPNWFHVISGCVYYNETKCDQEQKAVYSQSESNCTVFWSVKQLSNTFGLTQQGVVNTYTETSCKAACLLLAGCKCVDYNFKNKLCYSGTLVNPSTYPHSDTNHYDLITTCACPSNFTYLPKSDGCYQVIQQMLNWTEAKKRCQELNPRSYLLIIKDQTENNEIVSFIKSHYINFGGVPVNFYSSGERLIPGNCNSTFVWKPNDVTSFAMPFAKWYGGKPNCTSANESCIVLTDQISYQWRSVSCGLQAFPVCEIHY